MSDPGAAFSFGISDIGQNILKYLTEGLYPDPRDIIREYIQNSVDSDAAKITLKIDRQAVEILDDGHGMTLEELRNSLRLGLSDKDPLTNVGYKGIGMYCALSDADSLEVITSTTAGSSSLTLDLKSLRQRLNADRSENIETFFRDLPDSAQFGTPGPTDSQQSGIANSGTRIRLTGISDKANSYFYNKDELIAYLSLCIPLSFNKNFSKAKGITKAIRDESKKAGRPYREIHLRLCIDGVSQDITRPFKDKGHGFTLQDPIFKPISVPDGEETRQVAFLWACLNDQRKIIPIKFGQGLVLKMHGFTIGDTTYVQQFFSKGNKHFRRMVGEIIILDSAITPNAARNGIEFSEVGEQFKLALKEIADGLEKHSNTHQENSKALEERDSALQVLKKAQSESQLEHIHELERHKESLSRRIKQPKKELKPETLNALNGTLTQITGALDASKRGNSPESDSGADNEKRRNNRPGERQQLPPGTEKQESETTRQPKSSNYGIPKSQQVVDILGRLTAGGKGSPPQFRKLEQLYNSLCTVSCEQHPVLSYVGIWTFWEVLGKALATDPGKNSFGYLSSQLTAKGYSKLVAKDLQDAFKDLNAKGNINKHSANSFAETGIPLRNQMETLECFLVDMLAALEAKSKKSS